jgi:CheY-like chemotaxis protein
MLPESVSAPETSLAVMREAQSQNRPFDFVLLDYQMPGMDGVMVAQAIRADAALAGAQIVMLTSVGHSNEIKRLEGTAVDACLVKPVRQSQLLNALLISRSTPARPGRSSERPAMAARPPAAVGPEGCVSQRVLLVEDNLVNQRVATLMLRRLGMGADVAENGRQAVEMFRQAPYTLVFMDCQMPEMDGYEAARAIRHLEGSSRRSVIIAMTAEALNGARERCTAAGMDDYICKPVKMDTLSATVRRWLPE